MRVLGQWAPCWQWRLWGEIKTVFVTFFGNPLSTRQTALCFRWFLCYTAPIPSPEGHFRPVLSVSLRGDLFPLYDEFHGGS